MTISLRTCVKNKVKDGQRICDYDFTVKFWNKLLKEGKMASRNHKCTDQTLWNAFIKNYKNWYYEKKNKRDKEKLNLKMDLVESFFSERFIKETLEYYKKYDPPQWYKVKFKIKATREVPEEYYLRHGLDIPQNRAMEPNTFFAIDPKKWEKARNNK